MSDRTADELDADWAEAADAIIEATFSDRYTIKRPTKTRDGSGGFTITTVDVEAGGYCSLVVPKRQSGERLANGMIVTVTAYAADLPIASTVTTKDQIEINGRLFNITDRLRGGDWDMFIRLELEEVAS